MSLETKLAGDVAGSQKTKLTRNGDGALSASINPKVTLPSSGVELAATLYTSKKLELEVSKADLGVAGLKTTLKVAAKSFESLGAQKDAQSVSAEVEYLHERMTAALAVDLLAAKPQVALGITGAYENFTAGVEAKYSLGAATDLAALAAALHYNGPNYQATLTRTAADGARSNVAWNARLYQKIDDALAIGAELACACSDADKACAPTVAIGGQYKGARSDLKAKASTNGRIGLAYTQTLNYFSTVTLGLDISAANAQEHKIGAAFKFNA